MEKIEICIKGHLDKEWSKWLGGLTVTHTESGQTILAGSIRDQAATYGVLDKLNSLGLRLVSLSCENKPVIIKEE